MGEVTALPEYVDFLSQQGIKALNGRREYVAGPEVLKKLNAQGSNLTNLPAFESDLKEGRLDAYRGTFVAYFGGVLCGQSADLRGLRELALGELEKEKLSIFRVPGAGEPLSLDDALS